MQALRKKSPSMKTLIKMQKGNDEKHIKNTLGVFSNAKAYEKEMENRKWLSKSGSWLGFVVLILLYSSSSSTY